MEDKLFAVVQKAKWQELRRYEVTALLGNLTAAGTDPEKITAAVGALLNYNKEGQEMQFVEQQ